jgi:hypothetical protein
VGELQDFLFVVVHAVVAVGRFGLSGSLSEAAKIWKPDSPIQTLGKPDSPAVAGLSGFLGENPIFAVV